MRPMLGQEYRDFAVMAEQMTAEWQAIADAAAVSTLGDMPLVVLAAGKPNPALGDVAEKFQRYWAEQSRILADKSTDGRFILAEGASHFLYLDVPELVAESVLSLVHEARAK